MLKEGKLLLEKNVKQYVDYNKAFKLNYSHYKKVIEAKFEAGKLNFPTAPYVPFDTKQVQEGDYIKGRGTKYSQKNLPFDFDDYMSHLHVEGYVQRDEKGLFIPYCKRMIGGVPSEFTTFICDGRIPLDGMIHFEILWKANNKNQIS